MTATMPKPTKSQLALGLGEPMPAKANNAPATAIDASHTPIVEIVLSAARHALLGFGSDALIGPMMPQQIGLGCGG